jgi:hypothetical protein
MTGVIWRRDIPHGRCGMPPSASFAYVGTRAKSVLPGFIQLRCSISRSPACAIQRHTCDELNLVRNMLSQGLCAFAGTAIHQWKTTPMKMVTISNGADSSSVLYRLLFPSCNNDCRILFRSLVSPNMFMVRLPHAALLPWGHCCTSAKFANVRMALT